jgi:hypothetical protein
MIALAGFALTATVAAQPAVYEGKTIIRIPQLADSPERVIPVGERIVVEAGPSTVAVVDPRYERIDWMYESDGVVQDVVVHDGRLIVVGSTDSIQAFDAQTLESRWFYPMTQQTLLYLDQDIAVVGGFGVPIRTLNAIDLSNGDEMWPAFTEVPRVHHVDVTPDTIYAHPDHRPGWAYPIDRATGQAKHLHAVSLGELPEPPRVWHAEPYEGGTLVFTEGAGGVVAATDVTGVDESGGKIFVLAKGAVVTLEKSSFEALSDQCTAVLAKITKRGAAGEYDAQSDVFSPDPTAIEPFVECLAATTKLSMRLGTTDDAFLSFMDAVIDAHKKGALTASVAAEAVEQTSWLLPVMTPEARAKAARRAHVLVAQLRAQGADLPAYRAASAIDVYTEDASVIQARHDLGCDLGILGRAQCPRSAGPAEMKTPGAGGTPQK